MLWTEARGNVIFPLPFLNKYLHFERVEKVCSGIRQSLSFSSSSMTALLPLVLQND